MSIVISLHFQCNSIRVNNINISEIRDTKFYFTSLLEFSLFLHHCSTLISKIRFSFHARFIPAESAFILSLSLRNHAWHADVRSKGNNALQNSSGKHIKVFLYRVFNSKSKCNLQSNCFYSFAFEVKVGEVLSFYLFLVRKQAF